MNLVSGSSVINENRSSTIGFSITHTPTLKSFLLLLLTITQLFITITHMPDER